MRQGLPGVASSQVDSPQVSGCCDGVALRAQLLGTLRGEQGRLWLCTQCCMLAHVSTGLMPVVCWHLGPVSQSWEAWAASVSRQARSCVGGMPGSNRLASPAAGAPVMRTRLGPAVAAEALTRLHTAFDQDTEPTSGPFIAVSGRHFNGCSRAKNRDRSRGSLVMGGGGAEAQVLLTHTQPPPDPGSHQYV